MAGLLGWCWCGVSGEQNEEGEEDITFYEDRILVRCPGKGNWTVKCCS